jgi:hypothetical protein
MPLTDTACKNAKPNLKPYKKADSNGLFLHVMPTGSKYWRLKYRYMGKEKVLALGVYPEVSLAEARNKVMEARRLLTEHKDPSLAKQQAKHLAAISAETTLEAIAREWHETQKSKWTPNYAKSLLHRLEMDIFPALGTSAINTITAPQLLAVLRQIEKRGAKEIAHRASQVCGQIFRYAITTGKAERNPAADIRGALQPVKHTHFAALDAKELPEFLRALERNDARLYQHTPRRLARALHPCDTCDPSPLIEST